MSFDQDNLKRLREFSRQIPHESLTPNQNPRSKQTSKQKLHKIETEQNPQELFKELIKASPDGEVPKHLIARLKEIEEKALSNENSRSSNLLPSAIGQRNKSTESLYTSFQRLLLEEEED